MNHAACVANSIEQLTALQLSMSNPAKTINLLSDLKESGQGGHVDFFVKQKTT